MDTSTLIKSEKVSYKCGHWTNGMLPDHVQIGANSVITGDNAFKRFCSNQNNALAIGKHCTLDGMQFSIGQKGTVQIGNYCDFTSVILLCELRLEIGNYVSIGWNCTIADSDFHPVEPDIRIRDSIALSPLGDTTKRPEVECKPVVIGDDVFIGPNAAILKGVTVGPGSFIEPGSIVTKDIPQGSKVAGNPARVVGKFR